MLTTTPFFRPRDGCAPRPMMLSRFSVVSSATMATIFEVPISRPTIRFLLSFTTFASLSHLPRWLARGVRHAYREPVSIAQVDVVDRGAGTGERANRSLLVHGEARQALVRSVAPEFDRQRGAPGRAQTPAAAWRQLQLGDGEGARCERGAELAEMPGQLARAALGPGELRQLAVEIGAEFLALGVDERCVVPALQRFVLDHRDLEPIWPLPPQRHALDPGNALQRGARVGKVEGEESPHELLANHRFEVRAAGAGEAAVDDDMAQRERRLPCRPDDRGAREQHSRRESQRAGEHMQLAR